MGKKINKFTKNLDTIRGWEDVKIFDLNKSEDEVLLKKLVNSDEVSFISDNIEEAIEELYHFENPSQTDSMDKAQFGEFEESSGGGDYDKYGVWAYYPWNRNLVHFPPKDDFRKLRGSRNRNLITEEERSELGNNKTIVILGLSVGSNVVDSLLMHGVGSKYVLVDLDYLAPTNLNRIRASYHEVGIHKVDIVAKKISELDPYLEQVHYKNGLDESNLEELLEKHQPDIIIDEMDDLRMKLLVRMRAKEEKLPVLMATDNGDEIILDIERYDQSDNVEIFHGLLPENIIEDVLNNKKMSRQETGAIIGQYFVNLDNVPVRMIESLMEVGRSLPSWPQLGGAAVLSGLYVSYAARKILLGQEVNSGRFLMGPDEQLNPERDSAEYKKKKAELIEIMINNMPKQ